MTSPARKGAFSIVDRFIVSGLNFLTLVVVGRASGVEEFGVFVLAWTFLLANQVTQESLVHSPLTVFLNSSSDKAKQRSDAGAAFALQVLLSSFLMGFVFISFLAMAIFDIGDPVFKWTAWCLLWAIPAVSLREFARRYLLAHMQTIKLIIFDATCAGIQILTLATLWWADRLSPGTALLAMGFATVFPVLFWWILTRNQLDRPSPSFLISTVKEHWTFGRWVFGGQLADLTVKHGIAWLIALVAGTAATGIYAASNSLILAVNPIVFGIGSIFLPHAARAHHQSGPDEVQRIAWIMCTVLLALTGSVSLVIAIWGEFLVSTFYGAEIGHGTGTIVALLAVANVIAASTLPFENSLMVLNRQEINIRAAVIRLLVTLLFAAALTPLWGITGTAMSVLVGSVVGSAYHTLAFIQAVGPPRGDYFRRISTEH